MAVQATTTATDRSDKKKPFRGVLEAMAETFALKVEMGLQSEDDAVTELVRADGHVYGVTLKRMKPTAKK